MSLFSNILIPSLQKRTREHMYMCTLYNVQLETLSRTRNSLAERPKFAEFLKMGRFQLSLIGQKVNDKSCQDSVS